MSKKHPWRYWHVLQLTDHYELSDAQRRIVSNASPNVGFFYGGTAGDPFLYLPPLLAAYSAALALGANACAPPNVDRLTKVPGTGENFDMKRLKDLGPLDQ